MRPHNPFPVEMSSNSHNYVAVVDDDESLGRSLGRLLRAAGIEAVMYDSAEAFLEDSKRPQFDCLLLDVQLGGMSGIELNQRLSAAGSTTPVIYITAHCEPEIRAKALQTPCVAYLRKAEPAETVLGAIRKAMCRKED
jgi:FixJ family two-component response regulator